MYTIAALGAHATYTALAASLAPSLALSALLVVLLAALVYVLLIYGYDVAARAQAHLGLWRVEDDWRVLAWRQ
jgi:multisubunit Na+/H+ antiporter MnhB subunit